MAFSSALQNLGSSLAVFVTGVMMVKSPSGEILHYDWIRYIACGISLVVVRASVKVKVVSLKFVQIF